MITKVSDTHIRSFVRSHLARHQLDVQPLRLRVLNGTVEMSGELRHLGGRPATLEAIQKLERDIRATSGVRYVAFEFENWVQTEDGCWVEPQQQEEPIVDESLAESLQQPLAAPSLGAVNCFVAPISMEELLQARVRNSRSS